MSTPETKYARSGDLHIAYRVDGAGPPDVVVIPNWLTELESMQDMPIGTVLLRRLAAFCRLATFDQPGSGLSDPISGDQPTLEVYADSAIAVMDDAGMDRVAIVAWDFGALAAIMLAATSAERVSHLVLMNATARVLADEGYEGLPSETLDRALDASMRTWGTPANVARMFPSIASDEAACEAIARYHRRAASPGRLRSVYEMGFTLDLRPVLPSVRAPTLVIHPSRSKAAWPMSQAEYLTEHLPDARLLVYDSADSMPHLGASADGVLAEIQGFLTGERPPRPLAERILATVLFTDLVGSTQRASDMGDSAWSDLLVRHDDLARRTLGRYRGNLVKSTGDGLLATFDGPSRAVAAAIELRDATRKMGLEIRAGLHTGEIGVRQDDVVGIAVHIGARVAAMAGAGEVLVSSTVKDLVTGSGIEFEDLGAHELKGVPGEWRVFAVKD